MRIALILIAALCLAGSIYEAFGARNSYSSYSGDQLDELESAFRPAIERSDDDNFSLALLEDERRRRRLAPSLGIAAFLLVALSFAPARFLPSGAGAPLGAEDARLKAKLGDPNVLLEGGKHKAAALLGVQVGAPPEVIAAACEAQLKSNSESLKAPLPTDLKQMLTLRIDELERARDLLLGKKGDPPR